MRIYLRPIQIAATVDFYIYDIIRRIDSHKNKPINHSILNTFAKTYQTDTYMNSSQRPFPDAKYFVPYFCATQIHLLAYLL